MKSPDETTHETAALGPCDHCGGDIGALGWMKPTGETLALEVDGPRYPVYRFFCSQRCSDDDKGER